MLVPTRLASLPLPPSVLQRLALAGYETRADLDGLTPDELGVDLGIEASSATLLLRTVRGECVSAGGGGPWLMPRDALSMYEEERAEQRISTCAGELDRLLAGGVQLQKLSEFSGVPGVGKTQLAMQLALAVQLPEALNGLDGDTIYIDTEGSFFAPRCLAMAESLLAQIQDEVSRHGSPEQRAEVGALVKSGARAMLGRIHYYRVHDLAEQLAVCHVLPEAIGEIARNAPGRPGRCVRLVVVDSIAFHVRASTELTYAKRLQLVGQMAQLLSHAARRSPCAVVLINQVTTRVNEVLGTSGLVPALGEAWAHMCNVQVSLEWRDDIRLAALSKGGEPGEAQFAVTADGIRSADPSSKLLPPPRPVVAALAPPRLQRWPDAAAAPCADGGYGLFEPLAHGTKRLHEQASSSSSAVENLQPQRLARHRGAPTESRPV